MWPMFVFNSPVKQLKLPDEEQQQQQRQQQQKKIRIERSKNFIRFIFSYFSQFVHNKEWKMEKRQSQREKKREKNKLKKV